MGIRPILLINKDEQAFWQPALRYGEAVLQGQSSAKTGRGRNAENKPPKPRKSQKLDVPKELDLIQRATAVALPVISVGRSSQASSANVWSSGVDGLAGSVPHLLSSQA